MIALIEKGEAPWQKPWDAGISAKILKRPFNCVRNYGYSGGNSLRLSAKGLVLDPKGDPRWCTFREANEKGWKIKKGSKAQTVEFWKFNREQSKNEETGEVILGRERKPSVFFHKVFHASQIEDIPPYEPEQIEMTWTPVERAEQILVRSGATIRFNKINEAAYYPRIDEIGMPPKAVFPTAEKFYETALHELGHWTGHESRLNRKVMSSFGSPEYAKEEIRVEMVSLYLAMETGLSFEPQNHAAYLQGWVQVLKKDKNEFFRAARDAENITKYLLDFALEKTLQQEQPEQKKVWAVKDSVNEKVMEETAALLTEVCQCQAVMCKVKNKSIAFTPSAKGKNYQVTTFNEEGKPEALQLFESVREAAKYLHALGARAETICDRVIGEPKPEQKRLSAILLECVPKIKPTLSKLYKLRFKELLEQDLPYRKIDLEVAKSLLQEGHDNSRVQSTITKFSPQAVIDQELKYANKILQEVAPGIDKKVGKAMGL